MTPEQRREFDDMKKRLAALERVEDTQFIENIRRRLDIPAYLKEIRLGDLKDVDLSNITNEQVIKYYTSSTNWQNADDIDT